MNEIAAESAGDIMNQEEFIEKASFFVIAERIYSGKDFDFGSYIGRIDPNIPRAFVKSVIKNVVVTNGTVTAIEFRSGINCKFT